MRPNTLKNLRQSRVFGLLATSMVIAVLGACSAEAPPTSTKKAVGLSISGEVSMKVGGKNFVLDYAGGKADVNLVHKLATEGKACVTNVHVQLTKADETCLLDLTFRPGAGNALTLMEGEFHAVNKNTLEECADFPGLKPGKPQVYSVKNGKDAQVLTKPVEQPEAGQKDATIAGKDITITGSAEFKLGGTAFNATFSKLKLEGSVKSTGNANASCGALTGAAQCPDKDSVTMGNQVGDHLKRPGHLYDCGSGQLYELDELCGSDAIWLTMYRRWTEVACGKCADDEQCVKHFTSENSYQAQCWKKSEKCGACADAKKTSCVVDKGGKDVCQEPVKDGEDMSLKDVLGEYSTIFDGFSKNNVASIFVVAEGTERARGKCTEENGKTTCDGNGPAATQDDCKAVKEQFKLSDDVILLYDKNKKLWASNEWLGPEFYSNGMMVMSGETAITALFPDPSASGQPSTEQVKAAIQKAIDDF